MKKEQKKYGVLAFCMLLLLTGGLFYIESGATTRLAGFFVFCLICSAVLLYSLMKLNVMEFQPGSFWDRCNQRLNQPAKRTDSRSRQSSASLEKAVFHHSYWHNAA